MYNQSQRNVTHKNKIELKKLKLKKSNKVINLINTENTFALKIAIIRKEIKF